MQLQLSMDSAKTILRPIQNQGVALLAPVKGNSKDIKFVGLLHLVVEIHESRYFTVASNWKMKPDNFRCTLKVGCEEMFEKVEKVMTKDVIDLDFDFSPESNAFFKIPSSLRTLLGLINFLNQIGEHYMLYHSYFFDHKAQNLAIFLNCHPDHQSQIMASPVAPDMLEISGMQNVMEAFLPQFFQLRLNDTEQLLRFSDHFFMGWFSEVVHQMDNDTNEVVQFVFDRSVLERAAVLNSTGRISL